jgi:hypothetical protein
MDPNDELEFLRGFLDKKFRHVFGNYKKLLEKEIQARGTSSSNQKLSGTDGALLAPPPPPTVDVALEQRKAAARAAAVASAMYGPCSCLKSRCLVLYCSCFNK